MGGFERSAYSRARFPPTWLLQCTAASSWSWKGSRVQRRDVVLHVLFVAAGRTTGNRRAGAVSGVSVSHHGGVLKRRTQIQPELAVPQGVADLVDEGVGHSTVAEGAWWGAGHVHVLGPRQLGQGTQRDGRSLCGLRGEDAHHACARTACISIGSISRSVCAWERAAAAAAAGPAAATTDANGTDDGAGTAAGARGVPGREYGGDVMMICDL